MRRINQLLLLVLLISLVVSGCTVSESNFKRDHLIKNTDLAQTSETTTTESNETTEVEKETSSKKVVLATGEWPPYTSENLEGYGFNTEIMTKAFEVKGYEVEYQFEKWPRCVELTKAHNVFGTFPWGKTEERKEFFVWSDIVTFGNEVFWYMDGTDGIPEDFTGFDSIEGLKHGGVAAYSYLDKFDENNVPIEEAPDEAAALKKLFNGRVDMMPGSLLTTIALIEEIYPEEKDQFKYLKTPLNVNDMALMVAKDYPNKEQIIEDFNEGLKEIYLNGQIEDILKKHNLEVLIDGYERIMKDKYSSESTAIEPVEETIKLVTGEWPPYTSENLENYGFNTEIVTEAFSRVGYDVEYEFYKWARCVELTKAQNVFGTFPWGKTEERKKTFTWSNVVAFGDEVLWYIEGTDGVPEDFTGFDSIKDLKHGGVAAYSYLDKFAQNNVPIEEAPDEATALKKLYNGRVDMMPGTLLTTMALIEETYPDEKDKFKYLTTPLMSNDMAIMTSKDYPNQEKILEHFNIGLKEIYLDGTLEEILKKHEMDVLIDGYNKRMEEIY